MDAPRSAPPMQLLFSYGTLQYPSVQLETFGRLLEGTDDALPGYTTASADPRHSRAEGWTGLATRTVLRRTGNPLDKVMGRVLRMTDDELDASDEYELPSYRRVRVVLASGKSAWVYVGL